MGHVVHCARLLPCTCVCTRSNSRDSMEGVCPSACGGAPLQCGILRDSSSGTSPVNLHHLPRPFPRHPAPTHAHLPMPTGQCTEIVYVPPLSAPKQSPKPKPSAPMRPSNVGPGPSCDCTNMGPGPCRRLAMYNIAPNVHSQGRVVQHTAQNNQSANQRGGAKVQHTAW